MKETPDPADTLAATTNDRGPLGVRVIAAAMILFGMSTLVYGLVSTWSYGHQSVALGFLLVPLGWGLIRRRRWAHVCTSMLVILPIVATGLGLSLVAIYIVSCLISQAPIVSSSPWPTDASTLIGTILQCVVSMCLYCYLHLGTVRDWFVNSTLPPPFVVWNPARWQFSIGVLFFLTAIVAVCSTTVMMHPGLRAWRGQQWLAAQELTDPIYFPKAPSPLPPYFTNGSSSWGIGQDRVDIFWCISPGTSLGYLPEPGYVVFNHWDKAGDSHAKVGGQSAGGIDWHTTFVWDEGLEVSFPEPVQVVEFRDGRLTMSDLHITLLEFWSYLNSTALTDRNADRSLEGLESYIKDLRKRVAERDAARSVFP